jgi:hypothetical protein
MIRNRRIFVAGLPAAGITVLAALALSGSPASASNDIAAARVAVTASPCADSARDCPDGYGTVSPTTAPTRGHGGYGTVSPSTAPTPTASTDTVPPGVSPSSATPSPSSTQGGGVSAGHELPVTGPPMGSVISFGALLIAAGAASVWYTRRRRTA